MATIDQIHTTLTVRHGSTRPHVLSMAESPPWFKFKSPRIDAEASVRLVGAAGESVAGWMIGFMQLNIQHPVRSGSPKDSRFLGKEFSLAVPVSLTVSKQPSRIIAAADWRHI